MNTIFRTATAMTAAAAASMAAAPAMAQDALTGDAVRSFVEQSVQAAQTAIAEGNMGAVHAWHERHLADNARLAAKGSLVSKEGPVMTFTATMDRETLGRFGHMMMMGAQQPGHGMVGDFTLQADVQSVTELPNGQASATVVFQEAGTIAVPAPGEDGVGRKASAPERAQEGGMETEEVVFHTTSTCTVRFGTSDDDVIQIEMAACEAVTTLG